MGKKPRARDRKPYKPPPRVAMSPDRLLVRFDEVLGKVQSARIVRIEVSADRTMTVVAKIGGRLWIRSKPANDSWGWEGVLTDWRYEQACYIANRRAS